MTGQAVAKAFAQQNQIGAWVVNYNLTAKGSPLWDKVAQANFHQELAIELDGVVQSAPLIQPTQASFTSFAGSGEISGSFTQTSAKNLAIAMQFGSLPVRLNALTTQTVSPTLGHSSLVAGLGAGLVGLALVLLYTILYYRALGPGHRARARRDRSAAVGDHLGARPHRLRAELHLAGVTGLIVSIGITVDSYIVYFERLKDEARAGRSIRTSVDRGFRSAWRTVLAADTVSLLGRGAALPDRRGRRARLRLLPRPLDADGRLHHVVLHATPRGPARPARIAEPLGAVDGRRPREPVSDAPVSRRQPEDPGADFGRLYQGLTTSTSSGGAGPGSRSRSSSSCSALGSLVDPRLQPRHRLQGRQLVGGPRPALVDRPVSLGRASPAGLSQPIVEKLGSQDLPGHRRPQRALLEPAKLTR